MTTSTHAFFTTTVSYTVFGRNLPKGQTETADGRTYDRLAVQYALKGKTAADTLTTDLVIAPTGGAMDAHNSFANPNMVRPIPFSSSTEGGKMSFDMPAKSVAVVKLD